MSTLADDTAVPSSTPKSAKKRKSNGETPEASKKRRKHAELDGVISNSEKEHKKNKKEKTRSLLKNPSKTTQETQDVELSDHIPISKPRKEKKTKKKDRLEVLSEDTPAIRERQDVRLSDSIPVPTLKKEKKKKRKQKTSSSPEPLATQETPDFKLPEDTPMSTSKKEKRKKKKKEIENITEDLPTTQETWDTELPDVPEQAASPRLLAIDDDAPITNGIELNGLLDEVQEIDETLLQSSEPSCFYNKQISLHVPIPAISLQRPASSLLASHLAPLLLTYFPPVEGIVLSYSDPIISAEPSAGVNLPLQPPGSGKTPSTPAGETYSKCADAFGVCWVWLTATLLVFRPQPGDGLKGWTNVSSESFVGLISYNYFQTAVEKSRIPKRWFWDGPTTESNKKHARKGKLRDENTISTSQTEVASSQDRPYDNEIVRSGSGTFIDTDGNEIPATQTIRVVDVEMVPGQEKDRWTLQIDGSLLSPEEEAGVIEHERQRFEQVNNLGRNGSETPSVGPGSRV